MASYYAMCQRSSPGKPSQAPTSSEEASELALFLGSQDFSVVEG